MATEVEDCRLVNRDPTSYQACAHVIPEGWDTNVPEFRELVIEGQLENPQALGIFAQEGWHVPKFTLERDPTLGTYLGMQGEKYRRKMAETFLRPTSWKQYCDLISQDNCKSADDVAQRAPHNESENARMFVEGLFTGYFRKTEKNDCDLNNTTCTGFIVDYPCDWTSFVEQQQHHLDIALDTDLEDLNYTYYTYLQMTEIWRAANATKSDVIMIWWQPDALVELFQGTDAEFHKVALPSPTQECIENRVPLADKCSRDFTSRVGDARGACDLPPDPLSKVFSSGLYNAIYDSSIPEAAQSPAYQLLSNLQMTREQLGDIFDYWEREPTPREAICRWAVDNLDELLEFVPNTYPRIVREETTSGLVYAALSLGSLAILMSIVTAVILWVQRKRRAIVYAQVDFLSLLLVGSLMISVGAVVNGVTPSDASCVTKIWFINIGYTLELVPLLVKIAAINKLMEASRQMKRVKLNRRSLFGAVFLIGFLAVIFLIIWTALDPPRKVEEFSMSGTTTEDGSHVVDVGIFCDSESRVWQYIAVGWNALMLTSASILAFQTRHVPQHFNESQTLGTLIYSHTVFVILRLVTLFLTGKLSGATLMRFRDIIFSTDTIATIAIYFLRKFLASNEVRSTSQSLNCSSQFELESGAQIIHSHLAMQKSSNFPDAEASSEANETIGSDLKEIPNKDIDQVNKLATLAVEAKMDIIPETEQDSSSIDSFASTDGRKGDEERHSTETLDQSEVDNDASQE